jgi:heat shock protein HslJ
MRSDTELRWRLATAARPASGGGFELAEIETLELRIVRFTTVDDTTCAYGGAGATLVVAGERVVYACVGNKVVLGGLVSDALGLQARIGNLRDGAAGLEVVDVALVRLRSVELQDPRPFEEAPTTEVPAPAEDGLAAEDAAPAVAEDLAPPGEAEVEDVSEDVTADHDATDAPDAEADVDADAPGADTDAGPGVDTDAAADATDAPEADVDADTGAGVDPPAVGEVPGSAEGDADPPTAEEGDADAPPSFEVIPIDPNLPPPGVAVAPEVAVEVEVEVEVEVAPAAPAAILPPAPLLGTMWGLHSILLVDGTILAPDVRDRYTLLLGADGSALLQVDCNRAVGRFDLDGQQLAFAPFAISRAFCPDGDLETPYVTRMQGVARYTFAEGKLVLATANEDALLFFEPLR